MFRKDSSITPHYSQDMHRPGIPFLFIAMRRVGFSRLQPSEFSKKLLYAIVSYGFLKFLRSSLSKLYSFLKVFASKVRLLRNWFLIQKSAMKKFLRDDFLTGSNDFTSVVSTSKSRFIFTGGHEKASTG